MSDINLGDNMSGAYVSDDNTTLNIGYGAAQDMITITSSGISPLSSSYTTASTITLTISPEELLERYEMNLMVNEHKMQEQEMVALKDKVPDYADHIKSNIAKEVAKDLVKKMTFTKKKLPDEDVHHFIGRVYVFTKEELIKLIEDARYA